MHRLKAVRIELRLLLTHQRIARRFFRLDHSERLAIVAPEHVVGVAEPGAVGHPLHFVFPVAGPVEGPSRPVEVHVDEIAASLGLGVIVGIRLRGGGSPDLRELVTEGL